MSGPVGPVRHGDHMNPPAPRMIEVDPDTPTELYQLGIRYPDDMIIWGDPTLRAQDAKAQGYYGSEIDELHRHFRQRLREAHASDPDVCPRFVYRIVTLEYTEPKDLT